jgi:RNA polymerase sigma-70 factor (ECF subfamily)
MIAKQQIANHYRKVNRQPLIDEWDPDDADSTPEIEDPVNRWEEIWDDEYIGYLNGMALAKVKRKVSPKQYQIFHLYCIKELTSEKVAEILDVNPNEVYLAKNRVKPIYEEALRKSLYKLGRANQHSKPQSFMK